MRRPRLFELEDQSWFPSRLRDAGTAYLRFAAEVSGQAKRLAPRLAHALDASGAKRIVDLGSGGGGPIGALVGALRDEGIDVRALLTDRYPNEDAFRALAARSDGIDYELRPVDAMDVPRDLEGVRTLFNAFHHFPPPAARRILADAAKAQQPIAIFEAAGREPLTLLAVLFAPLVSALVIPFLRPLRWERFVFCWLIPIIPLFVLWDGLVSCLRVYSTDELRELSSGLGDHAYGWEIGRIRLSAAPVHATYLLGLPHAKDAP